MRNLQQVRARNALVFFRKSTVAGEKGGDVIHKVSPLIRNDGLLAAIAYSFGDKVGWQLTFDAIAEHLSDPDIQLAPESVQDRKSLMDFLKGDEATSETVKLATVEVMAWLDFAVRFVNEDS